VEGRRLNWRGKYNFHRNPPSKIYYVLLTVHEPTQRSDANGRELPFYMANEDDIDATGLTSESTS
jgi:hypothetical protein